MIASSLDFGITWRSNFLKAFDLPQYGKPPMMNITSAMFVSVLCWSSQMRSFSRVGLITTLGASAKGKSIEIMNLVHFMTIINDRQTTLVKP